MRYEELFNKLNTNPEEKDKEKQKQLQTTALRKKKNKLFELYNTAVDAEETAKNNYEEAVVNPNKIQFDAEYLAYQQAKATTEMYKNLYTELFGDLPK
jgi:hypothetical protein